MGMKQHLQIQGMMCGWGGGNKLTVIKIAILAGKLSLFWSQILFYSNAHIFHFTIAKSFYGNMSTLL